MRVRNLKVNRLLQDYKEISVLGKIGGLLSWDQSVNLPKQASNFRSIQSAYVSGLLADKWQNIDFIKLLNEAKKEDSKLTHEEKAIVRNLDRVAKFYVKVPKSLIVKQSEITSKAFAVWQDARRKNDFKMYLPILTQVVDIERQIANHIGYKKSPYDALLDLYEPGLTSGECTKIFKSLTKTLTKTLSKIKKSKKYDEILGLGFGSARFSQSEQEKIGLFVLKKIGYDFNSGRMDQSAHPFTITLGQSDVRITNRYKEIDFRDSIMTALHEGGHALYEQGVKTKYDLTPLEGGISLGIHESQSRFWENQIGRSLEFFEFITPILHASFPNELAGLSVIDLYRAFNQVKPSDIRVEADEVTYNLHIALRYEIEKGLIEGKIKVSDLSKIWKEKSSKYLGIVPKKDSDGVLQDVHWSGGSFGYFPTYTLGNLYAAQFMEKMKKRINVQKLVLAGNFPMILSWLRANIHEHGSLYLPDELTKKITGEKLNPKYFEKYIKNKYGALYEVKI